MIETNIESSSMISKLSYDPEKLTMVVIFTKGGSYLYKDIPKEVYVNLVTADSVGKYFLANIKNKYECEKLS